MEKEIEGIVHIGSKPVVERHASATGLLHLQAATVLAIQNKEIKKGDVLEASTIAAIQAVKETPRIIPHCHPIPLEGCTVSWSFEGNALRCTVNVAAHYKTGIEMEALTGVSIALLTVYDMCKAVTKDMVIKDIRLLSKSGGKSDYKLD